MGKKPKMRRLSNGSKKLKPLFEWAAAHGWTFEKTRGDHLVFTHPKVTARIYTAMTPSCNRAWMNARGDMRHAMLAAGFKPEEVK